MLNKISIIIPVYNEEDNILPFYNQITKTINVIKKYEFEFIFTDNNSSDKTYENIEKLIKLDDRIYVKKFTRNFGYQKSILEGYKSCSGNCAIQIDVDLQDPTDLINDFILAWERGYKVVSGIRVEREEGFLINSARRIFYRLLNKISEYEILVDAGDFRLIDRCIIELLNKEINFHPYIRGTIASYGYKQIGIPYKRMKRKIGYSKFNFFKLLSLSFDAILNHSTFPLRIASLIGVLTSCITLFMVVIYLVLKIFFATDWPAGFATLILFILISISINSLFLGILGEYLGRIYQQIKLNPGVIVEKESGRIN